MAENNHPPEKERRFALRIAMRLMVVVSGRAEDGAAWSEPTETDDLSSSGAFFHLNQEVNPGERLSMRSRRADGAHVEVSAQVIRVEPSVYGTTRVGVQIIDPAEDWIRLFVSWVSEEPSAAADIS